MSHIFISYSHDDTNHLTSLINHMSKYEISLWYDARLAGGDDWRDEISVAIDEAYALLLIITQNSMNSHYCTYEWAYGLGTGLPVLPLIFEDINFTDIHAPLRSKQFVNCTDGIPDTLVERLASFQEEPIDVVYLRRKISDAIMPFWLLIYTLIWYKSLPEEIRQQRRRVQYLTMQTRDESVKLYFDVLPELMTMRSHAFTTRLKKATRLIIDAIQAIHTPLHEVVFEAQTHIGKADQLFADISTKYREEVEPLISVIIDNNSQQLFSQLVEYLKQADTKRPDPFLKMNVQILFGLHLDEEGQKQVMELIDSVVDFLYPRQSQKPKKE